MTDHAIRWTHEEDRIVGAAVCRAQEGAQCRTQCPAGCEVWELDGHEHGYEAVDCLALTWWDNLASTQGALWEFCDDDGMSVMSYPITVNWDGDNWLWSYAEDES